MQHPEKPGPERSALRMIEARVSGEQHGGSTRVLMGTAKRYAHPLVLGPSSVHSNPSRA